jgi:hypothetical protein
MLNNLSKQIRECYRHAEDCARQAAAQTDPKLKGDLLDMEWDRVTDFSAETKRQAKHLSSIKA